MIINTLASGGSRLNSSNLPVFLRGNISATDCTRELLKTSKDSASLHICNEKKNEALGFL